MHATTGYSSYTTHAEARLQDKESALRRREHRVQRAEALVKEERDRLEATKQEVCMNVCLTVHVRL
jgi:Tfp pilus assembly protein PilX